MAFTCPVALAIQTDTLDILISSMANNAWQASMHLSKSDSKKIVLVVVVTLVVLNGNARVVFPGSGNHGKGGKK